MYSIRILHFPRTLDLATRKYILNRISIELQILCFDIRYVLDLQSMYQYLDTLLGIVSMEYSIQPNNQNVCHEKGLRRMKISGIIWSLEHVLP